VTNKQPKRKARPGVDEYGRTPLHYAVIEHKVAIVKALLASGADPSVCDDDGWTPLHFAAQEYAPEICAALLAAGALVDAADSHGNTPLWRAVFDSRGRGEVIRVLRAHGASPTLANARGISPISLARTIANYDVGQFFVDIDPDSRATDRG
jgi:ankyrin repeat protein